MHTGDWVRLVFARVPCVVVLMCHSLSRYSRPHKHCHFSVIPDKAAMWFCFPKYLSCCFSWMQCSRKQFVFHKFFFHFRRYFYKQTKYKRRIASSRRHPYIIRTVQCWRFITHNHLRINFTIHEIVFSARHVNCTKGFFGMSSIAVNLKQTDTILSFCEKYPKMRVYVSKNQFKAHISVDNYVAFAVQFSFSVINSYSAIHLPENQYKTDLKGTSPAQLSNSKSHNSRPPWTLFFLKKDSFLYNCHLVVHKIYKILLFLPNYRLLCYQIFDSPRPTSTSLNLTYTQMEKAIFSTTSFQCFVQMQLTSSAKNMISCEYRSVIVNNSFDIFLSENMSTPYFFISTINFLSQVLVQAPSGHFINGTFKYFNYNGSDSSACFYGGVSAYKNSSQTLTEIFMSCQHPEGVLENPNIYSDTSSLVLVSYCYKTFCEMEIKVVFTVFNCNVFHYDICHLRYRHSYLMYDIQWTAKTGHYQEKRLSRNCIVIQLKFGTGDPATFVVGKRYFCVTYREISFAEIKQERVTINYQLTGYLTGNTVFFLHQPCSSRMLNFLAKHLNISCVLSIFWKHTPATWVSTQMLFHQFFKARKKTKFPKFIRKQ